MITAVLRLRTRAPVRPHLRTEAGFTMIEVLVAAVIAVIVIGAGAVMFSSGDKSSLASQRQGELISVADQQIENIRQAVKRSGFAALTMQSAPLAATNSTLSYSSTTHTDPNDFVSASGGCGPNNAGYLIEANYDSSSEGLAPGVASWANCATGAEPLVVQAGGVVNPKQPSVTVGSDTATVYSYVTDTYVGCMGTPAPCAGDARRVIVAVVLNNGGRHDIGQSSPVYVSSIFTNPVPSNQVNNSIGITLGVNLG